MPKVAGDIVDELVVAAQELVPKTKQEAFWAKVHTLAQELNEIMEFQRHDGYEIGFGEGRAEGYDHGYHDGVTDRPVEEDK